MSATEDGGMKQKKQSVALTRAEERVLRKAAKAPIARAGSYSGGDQSAASKEGFDRPLVIDRCIARGLLAPTDWFNKYALTALGAQRLEAREAKRAKRRAEP